MSGPDEVRQIIGYIELHDGWAVYYELNGIRCYEVERWPGRDEVADAVQRTRDRLTTWQVGEGRVVCIDNIERTFALRCREHPMQPVFVGALGPNSESLTWHHDRVACEASVPYRRDIFTPEADAFGGSDDA